ncbi:IS3 family transposase [Streptomyces sp. NPDC058287]|uniref:IS3 family transposase n=1 Tax=unclassified Streptomyces TaxID=2593676 RepID=UPI0036E3C283
MRYPPELRRQALQILADGEPVKNVAAALGLPGPTLYQWRRRHLPHLGRSGHAPSTGSDLAAARRRITQLETELAAWRRVSELLREVLSPKRRFEAVHVMAGEGLPVRVAARVLGVTESGYFTWRARPPSARSLRHVWLTELITVIHAASNGTFGYRRIHSELTHGYGITVSHGTVELLMRRAGLQGAPADQLSPMKGTGPCL